MLLVGIDLRLGTYAIGTRRSACIVNTTVQLNLYCPTLGWIRKCSELAYIWYKVSCVGVWFTDKTWDQIKHNLMVTCPISYQCSDRNALFHV